MFSGYVRARSGNRYIVLSSLTVSRYRRSNDDGTQYTVGGRRLGPVGNESNKRFEVEQKLSTRNYRQKRFRIKRLIVWGGAFLFETYARISRTRAYDVVLDH